jgi:hypothetical protein
MSGQMYEGTMQNVGALPSHGEGRMHNIKKLTSKKVTSSYVT